ncbi:MAG: MBL fold metallo-hydrolase [Nocardioidaceae bacterium]
MRITKFGHACVRIESGGVEVVIDPGSFTSPEAVEGVDAVLITHEHFDHFSLEHLQRTEAPIFTIAAVADAIAGDGASVRERVTVIGPGESFDAAGLPAQAVGEMHAVIHPDSPTYFNSGFVVRAERTVYHPGDSFALPEEPVDVLLVPVSGPWLKLAESIDFGRAVQAPAALAIHELLASDLGLRLIDSRMEEMLASHGSAYQRLGDGEDMAL